ncbi:MAG TPA: transglutaminase-like domain-containing protein [Fimbriiglobus sp.]|nr:transglutaminase-like domain-containing protein [Fimbriiglobus sp.]
MRLLLLLAGALVADGPPGSIVIRPGGSGAAPTRAEDLYPDKPGFIVIRPQRAGSLPRPRSVAEAGVPVIRIVRGPGGKPLRPEPPAAPQPATKPTADATKDGRVVQETWDATYFKGQPIGYFHVVVREYERDGRKFLYATKKQKMTVSRFGQAVETWGEDATMETLDGRVLTTRMSQGIGNNQMLALTGRVNGKVLEVTIEGAAGGTQQVPWPDGVIGIAKEATLLKDRKPKVGESFDYLSYEGRLNRVVKFAAAVKAIEEVPLHEGQKPRKLLRVVLSMEPIKLPDGGEFRMPPSTLWADAQTYEPLKMESGMPTLGGTMTVLRTTKEVALRKPVKLVELFDVQSIRLDRVIANVHDQAAVTYRVKLSGDLPPDKVFAQDARQTVENVDPAAKTFELHVTAVRGPAKAANAAAAGEEYLAPSFFIDWDNDVVRGHARQAAANLPATATAWQKARAVEAWVNRNMRATEFSQAMATCANVAKSLSGDCTEYAMLAAGMCRALGVPSRTALGLVYALGRDGKPYLAYHMWYEVYVDGQWLALDATLGRGSVGPGHVKITAASWHEEKSFAPLLPVLTVLGSKPQVEVVKVVQGRR